MKVAVISAAPTLGKTTLCQLLAGVFSRSQGREAVILTTGDARDNLEVITKYGSSVMIDSPHIFKAMLTSAGEDKRELYDYATQAGEEKVYIFDIMSSSMSQEDREDMFIETIKTLPAPLTLIEIAGDYKSEFNQKVLSMCDCALVLIDQSKKGIRDYDKLHLSLNGPLKLNHCVILAQYNNNIASDKKFQEITKIPTRNTYKFPYMPILKKLSFNEELEKVPYEIVHANSEVVELRTHMQELMSYMFDSPNRKVIRGIDKWYK